MGTTTVVKHRTSSNYRLTAPGGGHTAEEVYKVWWVPGGNGSETFPGLDWLTVDATLHGLPKLQSRMDGCDENGKFWVVDSQDWRVEAGKAFTFTVSVHYKSMVNWFYSGADKPWVRITRNSQIRQMQCWRDPFKTGITLPPTNGITPWPPSNDIGGTKIDINGQPATIAIPQCAITIEYHWHRGVSGISDGTTEMPTDEIPSWLFDYVGTRNDSSFFGFEKGSVLFSGISCSPVDQLTYIVQMRYVWDSLNHNEQRPAPNIGNAHFIEPVQSTYIGVPFKQATKVAWYQPYYDMSPFNEFYPAAVYDAIGKSYPDQNSCTFVNEYSHRPMQILVKPSQS